MNQSNDMTADDAVKRARNYMNQLCHGATLEAASNLWDHAIEEVRREEREACAKVAESQRMEAHSSYDTGYNQGCDSAATVIRARISKEEG